MHWPHPTSRCRSAPVAALAGSASGRWHFCGNAWDLGVKWRTLCVGWIMEQNGWSIFHNFFPPKTPTYPVCHLIVEGLSWGTSRAISWGASVPLVWPGPNDQQSSASIKHVTKRIPRQVRWHAKQQWLRCLGKQWKHVESSAVAATFSIEMDLIQGSHMNINRQTISKIQKFSDFGVSKHFDPPHIYPSNLV